VLDGHQHRGAPLAAQTDPLAQAQPHQQHRGQDSHLVVRRQQPDQERRRAHVEQGQHEHRLAPPGVPEVPEEGRPERAGDEAGGEGRQGRQGAQSGAEGEDDQPGTLAGQLVRHAVGGAEEWVQRVETQLGAARFPRLATVG
jgi:hypothetical protein